MTTTDIQIPGYVAGTWTIDAVHTYVGFVVRHAMVAKVRGRFTAVAGEIVTAPNPLDSSVSVTIEATSIDTNNAMRDDHIRSADFFQADSHPQLVFVSTGIRTVGGEFFVDGDLTIRGVTRPVTLAVDAPAFGPGPVSGTKAGFSATTTLNRHDFGVSYNGPIPGGGTIIGDKIEVVLDIEADLQATT